MHACDHICMRVCTRILNFPTDAHQYAEEAEHNLHILKTHMDLADPDEWADNDVKREQDYCTQMTPERHDDAACVDDEAAQSTFRDSVSFTNKLKRVQSVRGNVYATSCSLPSYAPGPRGQMSEKFWTTQRQKDASSWAYEVLLHNVGFQSRVLMSLTGCLRCK